MTKKIENFNSKDEAFDWMYKIVDDPCIDNTRFAFDDDDLAVVEYENQKQNRCCGYFDVIVTVNGRTAFIGCNYGH